MKTWFKKQLGDGILAYNPLAEIKEAFYTTEYLPEMAVFTRHNSDGQLHCDVTVYFSPATANLAHVFNAMPCPPPIPENLILLAGDEDSLELLFTKKR